MILSSEQEPIYFDAGYLSEQSGIGVAASEAASYYRREAWRNGLNPNRYFDTRWYAWQNPDWQEAAETPFDHYLLVGRHQLRDPTYLVDATRCLDVLGSAFPAEDVLAWVLRGLRGASLGVLRSLEDLPAAQAAFRNAIRTSCLRSGAVCRRRRNLVWLQAGRKSVHRKWYREERRTWDLLVNYYDPAGFDPALGDHVFFQAGTKFTAIAEVMRTRPDLLLDYDHVLFLDDDIETSMEDIDALFRTCAEEGLDLAQMSLTQDSHCVWPSLRQAPESPGLRSVEAVEIMMPVVSRRALREISGSFVESVSGFGLDLLWASVVKDFGGNIAVIDRIAARHGAAIDDRAGAYYSYLRKCGINPKAELWRLVTAHDLPMTIGQ